MITEEAITIFFFGSPSGSGFTSYPSNYLGLASGLDKSESAYRLESSYQIENNKSILKYIEYGLNGISKDGSQRGGRNFGIWIEILEYKITSDNEAILTFLKDWVKEALIDHANVFDVIDGKKYYKVITFDEVDQELNQVISTFPQHLINEFKNNIKSIEKDDDTFFYLTPKDNSVKANNPNVIRGLGVPKTNVEKSKKKRRKKKNKNKSRFFTYVKKAIKSTNFLIFLLLLLSLLNWFKDNVTKQDMHNRLIGMNQEEILSFINQENVIEDLNSNEIRYLSVMLLKKIGQSPIVSNTQIKQINKRQVENLVKKQNRLITDDEILSDIAEKIGELKSKDIIKKFQKAINLNGDDVDGIWASGSKDEFKQYFNPNNKID